MRKNLLKLMLLPVVMAASMTVGAQTYGSVLSESFENGIPETWTQENPKGNHDWVVDSGGALLNPNGAYDGKKRVALRNESGMTIGYVTKLVSPVVDISRLHSPILRFAHAQAKWTNDFDVLRVYYRTDTTKGWTPLREYTSYLPKWQYEEIQLNQGSSKTFQIAFEGSDGMGKGIVLDAIELRSMPNCTQPTGVSAKEVYNTTAKIQWDPIFDAEHFLLKVGTDTIDMAKLDSTKANILDTLLSAETFEYALAELISGQKYYVYVKSICPDDDSPWSEEFSFKTQTLVSVPYEEKFNLPVNAGFNSRVQSWSYGSSEGLSSPWVNTGSESYFGSFSRDYTPSLMFTGFDETTGTPDYEDYLLEPNTYLYAVSPQIDISDLSLVEVSFFGFHNMVDADGYRLKVGVMTNPLDFETFEEVEQVEIFRPETPQEFVISLSSYEGTGKYIALVTEFTEGTNFFCVDDFRVDSIESCVRAREINVSQKIATEASITWYTAGATKAEIILDTMEVTDPDVYTGTVISVDNAANGYKAKGLKPWKHYNLYVRNVCGGEKGEWSQLKEFRTPDTIVILDFNQDFSVVDYNPIGSSGDHEDHDRHEYCDGLSKGVMPLWNSASGDCPKVWQHWDFDSNILDVGVDQDGRIAIVSFPQIQNVGATKVEIVARQTSDLYSQNVEVGILTDVHDINSFVALDTIKTNLKDKKFRVNLDAYEGEGRFFAIKVRDDGRYGGVRISEVVFSPIDMCKDPRDVSVNSTPTTTEISWDASEGNKWEFIIYEKQLVLGIDDRGDRALVDSLHPLDTLIVTEPEVVFTTLKANGTEHAYTIRNICESVNGEWLPIETFITPCHEKNPLPFVMDFEGYILGSNNEIFALPCWTALKPEGAPVLDLTSDDNVRFDNLIDKPVARGYAALEMEAGYWGTKYWQHIVSLPEMDADIKDLEISFWIKADALSTKIEVGVVEQLAFANTFEALRVIEPEAPNKYEEIIVPLDEYTGDGKYITLRAALTQNLEESIKKSMIMVDDITVRVMSKCPKVLKVHSKFSATTNSAVVSWERAYKETAWDIVISKYDTLTLEQLEEAEIKKVNENQYNATDLDANTTYYYYVRANCGSTKGDWCPFIGEFRTKCAATTVDMIGVEGFESSVLGTYPECWIVGNKGATTAGGEIPMFSRDYKHDGEQSLKLHSTREYNGAYAIATEIDVDDIRNMQVSFWATCTYPYVQREYKQQLVVGVVSNPYDLSTFKPIDTITGFADEQYFTVQFNNYKGDGAGGDGKNVMFLSEFDRDNIFYIDDVRFDTIPECQWPEGITIDSLTHNYVSLEWKATSSPYEVIISTVQLSEEELNTAKIENADTIVAKIAGITILEASYNALEANTGYFIYVASECKGKQSWSPAIRFTTNCLPAYALPFSENFDSYERTGLRESPSCWTTHYTALGQELDYPYIINKGTTKNALYVAVAGDEELSFAITPRIDIEDISKCRVHFNAKGVHHYMYYGTDEVIDNNQNSGEGSIVVGVASDVSSPTAILETFVPVDTVRDHKFRAYQGYTVYLDGYEAGGKYIVFTAPSDLNGKTSWSKNRGMVIDDIMVEEVPACDIPYGIEAGLITNDAADITWIDKSTTATAYEVFVTDSMTIDSPDSIKEEKNKIFVGTVTGKLANIDGLMASSTYRIFVRTICGASDKSDWSEAYDIMTLCPSVNLDHTYGFEEEEGLYRYMPSTYYSSGKLPDCFVYGSTTGKKVTEYYDKDDFFNVNSETNDWRGQTIVAKTGKNALTFQNGNYGGGSLDGKGMDDWGSYVVLPEMNEDMDSILITFWMRQSAAEDGELTASEEFEYSVTIGTVESPTDMSTYKKVEKVKYPYSYADINGKHVDEDLSGNKYWVEYSVAIGNVGGNHIVLINDPTDYKQNKLYIDDLTISKISTCNTPTDVEIKVTDDKMDVNFASEGGSEWKYLVSEKSSFVDVVATDIINSTSFTVSNLEANTGYYVKVQQLCSDEEQSLWSNVVYENTAREIKYREDFNAEITYPESWKYAEGNAYDIFAGNGKLEYPDLVNSHNWRRSTENIFTSGHQLCRFFEGKFSTQFDWLITPTFYIGDDYEKVSLSFDLALTDNGSSNAPAEEDLLNMDGAPHKGNMFMVLISTDGGNTWTEEDATIWDNMDDSLVFNNISTTGELVYIDLASYVGGHVTVAFYMHNASGASTMDLHLDNVNINYITTKEVDETICETEDYEGSGFAILGKDLSVGDNIFKRTQFSTESTPDTAYTLNVQVTSVPDSTINAVLCEGYVYNQNGFNTSEAGESHQKYFNKTTGCDSVLTLNLTSTLSARVVIFDTICQGMTYELNDKVYEKSQIILDTLRGASDTGCDSIVTVYLEVSDALKYEEFKMLCAGEEYVFGDSIITTSGEYEQTFATDDGCDSVVHLTVNVMPVYDTTITATICKGESYSNGKFFTSITKEGTYPIEGESVDGCDSTVTLILTVIGGDTSKLEHSITTNELPYTYDDGQGNVGREFPIGTKEGVYYDTLDVSIGDCEGVLILTLTVKLHTSTGEADYTEFSIIPNPIAVGESVTITVQDNDNIVLCEVYNSTGSLMNRQSSSANPIILSDFYEVGLYMVRVVCESGKVYIGKVIVN